jgi:Skp family chaperone for outer membrane proteins
MKLISLIPCIILILFTTANAEDIIKCIDADGNTILTSSPQDGMKCFVEQPKEEPKKPTTVNLVDYCRELNAKLDDIQERKDDIDKQNAKLSKEMEDLRNDYYKNPSSYEIQSRQAQQIMDKKENLGDQYSALNKKQSDINEEIKSYKCNQMYNDMSRIQSQINSDSRNRNYRR